jgi:lysozyme
MKASENAYNLIRSHTSLNLEAYQNEFGSWAIGYNYTFKVKPGDKITQDVSEIFLKCQVTDCEHEIDELGLQLDQNQFDSLVSFVFNQGIGRLKASTLLKLIRKNKNDKNIIREFERYVTITINKKLYKSENLIDLRYNESKLYFQLI